MPGQKPDLATIDQQINNLKATMNYDTSALINTTKETWWSVTDAMTISITVLIFGLLILILATYLIKLGKSPQIILRIFGTIFIITAAIFLVVAGYSDQQIAPAMGLLGTIAGYLLGKDTKEDK